PRGTKGRAAPDVPRLSRQIQGVEGAAVGEDVEAAGLLVERGGGADAVAGVEDLEQVAGGAVDDEQAGAAAGEDQVAADDDRLGQVAGLGEALAPDDVTGQVGGVHPLAGSHEEEAVVGDADVPDALDGEAPLDRAVVQVDGAEAARVRRDVGEVSGQRGGGVDVDVLLGGHR